MNCADWLTAKENGNRPAALQDVAAGLFLSVLPEVLPYMEIYNYIIRKKHLQFFRFPVPILYFHKCYDIILVVEILKLFP